MGSTVHYHIKQVDTLLERRRQDLQSKSQDQLQIVTQKLFGSEC